MKTILFVVVAVLVVAVLVLGVSPLWTSAEAAREQIRNKITDLKSNDQLAAEMSIEIDKVGEAILEAKAQAILEKENSKESESRAVEVLALLEKQRSYLLKSRDQLTSGDTSYVVGGRKVTRERLAADARERLAFCKKLEGEAAALQAEAESSLRTAKSLEDGVAKAETARLAKVKQLKDLMRDLKEAEVAAKAADLRASLSDSLSSSDSVIARNTSKLAERAAKLKAKASSFHSEEFHLLDFAGKQTDDGLSEIDAYLSAVNESAESK